MQRDQAIPNPTLYAKYDLPRMKVAPLAQLVSTCTQHMQASIHSHESNSSDPALVHGL